MKRKFRTILSITLCLMMILGNVAVGGEGFAEMLEAFSVKASAAKITDYKTGDIIEFGWYPQTDVTSSMGATLNSKASEWKSYKYYEGTGSYGAMHESDYMYYCDVIYGNNKYRGVKFNTYRPYWTVIASTISCGTYQDDNGYTVGNTYWFKYEPIKWRVLDPSTGLVLSDAILDSQAYNNYILYEGNVADPYYSYTYWGDSAKTYYANNYANSSIRQWLNNEFYNTAFSTSQQSKIQSTTLDNSAYSSSYSAYDSASTTDKIFLLSYAEVQNTTYGFTNSTGSTDTRTAKGSDYAKCQGLSVYSGNGNSCWRLRSAGDYSFNACYVYYDGYVYNFYSTSITSDGVRAALKLKTETQSDVSSSYSIRNMSKYNGQTIDYKASLTVYADVQNCIDLTWYVEGAKYTEAPNGSITINEATGDFSVFFTAKDLDGNIVASEIENVKVNTGFFAKLIAFFKGLFGLLPDLKQ